LKKPNGGSDRRADPGEANQTVGNASKSSDKAKTKQITIDYEKAKQPYSTLSTQKNKKKPFGAFFDTQGKGKGR